MTKTIEDLFQETRNPNEIARRTDTEVAEVRRRMEEGDLEDLPGWGPCEKQPHIVSRRHALRDWPSKDALELMDARRLHDQGRVNMAQGRDGDFIIQYAFPNDRRVVRAPYFYGGITC